MLLAADDKMTMRELYNRLPSLDATVTRKRRDTDSKTQGFIRDTACMQLAHTSPHIGKIMSDWKRLLKLESQYGSLTNTPTKTTIINKLTEVSTCIMSWSRMTSLIFPLLAAW